MRKITTSDHLNFSVQPRWPYRDVFIEEETCAALQQAQEVLLQHELKLVLTRGYEDQGTFIRWGHAFARIVGALLFYCLYPARCHEAREIFSPNGHDTNGRSIDINIMSKGKTIALLPLGVFTPARIIQCKRETHKHILLPTLCALEEAGFLIHANKTEAMQIHCELVRVIPNEV